MKSFRAQIEEFEIQKTFVKPFESCKVETLSTEKTIENDRLVTKSVIKVDDSFHRYDGLNVSDFFIENQLDAGTMLNNEVKFSLSQREIIDNIELSLKNQQQ